ncbi:XRE family transcriptional regulator [Bacillus glycinifermentans]|uniref:Helix-turn-helix transcriptional regulator n=2 Tax=Bacillus glycinifermentans TaxID=1664069 RepID=A0A0J6EZY4_9BACI|nr:helix-turn-helix transcriptional regulator [Bacillus glycinifermentans]ATH95565.1 XRE family transcriptional regulator [Bacillus glycinifermentans]KMM63388.1 XRE family transcriptional regulator [Bacillus glycinifermentans]KRT95905.1 XRE family transcriptional regulator [Bacillus glycinifermentans]MEC0484565.1 helix-turn-helix transcriptional regulator [Bacillus glycinifermentans]MEC0496546.1 helix-turn-helix transcriptional regulator [Bacillus glycinifermentans]
MTLGERLKKARKKAGYSQKEAAIKVNSTEKTISNYERDYRNPDPETLRKLSELYDVSTDYLLGRKPHTPSKLDETVNEALEELMNEETLLFMKNDEEIDEETARLIKQALINGIKYVDAMKKKK